MASHGPQCKRRCKRKSTNFQVSENNENVEPIAVIDLTVDTPVRLPKSMRQRLNIEPNITIDLEDSTSSLQESRKSTGSFICPICYEALKDSLKPMSTKCGHIFCQGCLTTAMKFKKKCPKCQTNITERSCTRLYFDHK